MRTLVVEDDFTSRKLLQRFLAFYGECDVAVNGTEAVEAFRESLKRGDRYDLICLDIRLPEKNGHEVLEEIRRIEAERGINGLDASKVIMTTAAGDAKSVCSAFRSQCDGYLVKPYDRSKMAVQLKELGLIKI
ncbi:MAG: response regulator [candidate division FCPU426 bacterium]